MCFFTSGIIPAYAGQINYPGYVRNGNWDHPRIRGTNEYLAYYVYVHIGSSPHTRDKLNVPINVLLAWDHPRIRGTNYNADLVKVREQGSSPHTRDKLSSRRKEMLFSRIIPAYAGQIGVYLGLGFNDGDHPRIRGTNQQLPFLLLPDLGSSPHTRDKFHQNAFGFPCSRIIPAYAGQIL